jgi:predicted secreted protein
VISPILKKQARHAAMMVALVAAGPVGAQLPAVPAQPIVTVSASATATVGNDRLQAWLRA